jgi:hypothetical protein
MVADQNHSKTNDEPTEDGLSALKRLAALDDAGPGEGESSQTPGEAEAIPDWLELLLVKYGEEASELVGLPPDITISEGPIVAEPLESEEASEVASLLERMAAETEVEPPTDQLATSVDWGEPARPEAEGIEDQTPDWLDEISESTPTPPIPPADEETPEWLRALAESRPEAEPPPERPEHPPDAEEVPDWLEDLAGATPDQGPEDALPGPEDVQDLDAPDWMKELGVTTPAEETPPPPEGEAPDWLRDLEVAGTAAPQGEEETLPTLQETAAPPEVPETEEAEGELPDWLARLAVASAIGAEKARDDVEPSPPEVPPPPEATAEAPVEPEEDIPDWLGELETAEEVTAVEPSPPEISPTPPPEIAAEAPAEPEEDVPDWLRELEAAEGVPAESTIPEAPAEADSDVPDWLASMRQEAPSLLEMMAEEETSPAEYPEGEAVEEPEWLAALRLTSPPEVLELDEEAVEAEEDLPDWLAALRASQEAAETPPPVPELPPEPVEAEEPEILEEYHPPIEAEAAFPEGEGAPPTPAPAEEEAGALDWLAEIEAAAAFTTPPEGEAPVEADEPPVAEEVPDWLRQMPPADLTKEEVPEIEEETVETRRRPEWLVAETVPDLGEEEGEAPPPKEAPEIEEAAPAAEEIIPAEIPDWLLTLKPEETEPAELREEETIESEGVLADIPGLLPIVEEEPEAEEEPIAALRSRMGVPAVPDVEGAQLFKEVTDERPEAEGRPVEAESRRRNIVGTLVWALVFIILIAGIILALLAVLNRVGDVLGGTAFPEFFGSPLVIDPAPVNTFRAQVTKLPPDAVAVVSFDYSPATGAEMEPLAEIIVRDLLDNQARVIAVSLRPEGPMMAQRVFKRLESEHPYGERVINLGYLPGQTAGVRSLAFLSSAPVFQNWGETLDDYTAWQDVDGLEDVALIVPVSDSALALRWWVEQMGPGTLANRPMVAAVSAAADPSVRPYYNHTDPKAGQLLGLVSGVTDAAAYENRLGQPGRAVNSLAAQSVAHLGLVIIGLGGTVAGFRMQATREE